MQQAVQIGAKLKKKDSPEYVVEVMGLTTPLGAPPHAWTRVRMANHDLGERLYSVSALEDPSLFVPVGEQYRKH